MALVSPLVSGLICSIALGAVFGVLAYYKFGGMGWGDVKLVALIGLVLGFPLIIYWLLASAVIAIIWAIWIIKRGGNLKTLLPVGASFSLAAIVCLLLPAGFTGIWF